MQARLTTKPIDDVIAAIQALDLEPVKTRLMDAELGEGWSQEYADSIEAAYRTYLTMLVKYPDDADDILLSKDVDEFWHTHILQTMKYADDCQNLFGNFLHHNPHVGKRSSEEAQRRVALMEKTRHLYQLEFGSEQAAQVAWGGVAKNYRPAYCEATLRTSQPAYCEAAIRSAKPAYCEATVRAGQPAYCEAAVRSSKAAYCEAAIRSAKPAYCEATVRAGQPAYCEAVVRSSKAAYCEAAIRSAKPAYCEATVRAGLPAYCEAAIRSRNAA